MKRSRRLRFPESLLERARNGSRFFYAARVVVAPRRKSKLRRLTAREMEKLRRGGHKTGKRLSIFDRIGTESLRFMAITVGDSSPRE